MVYYFLHFGPTNILDLAFGRSTAYLGHFGCHCHCVGKGQMYRSIVGRSGMVNKYRFSYDKRQRLLTPRYVDSLDR
jgi:hypothetical protein